jgi:hypothetical protein
MESLTDPETAQQLHPDWGLLKFPNGEWVFGYGINSHGIRLGRGTLVVKDSRGQVRIFFGHICGENGGVFLSRDSVKTLDDFYRDLQGSILREWVPDQ